MAILSSVNYVIPADGPEEIILHLYPNGSDGPNAFSYLIGKDVSIISNGPSQELKEWAKKKMPSLVEKEDPKRTIDNSINELEVI